MTAFTGFPEELFAFFEGLGKDNSKDYWNANRATWQEKVRKPMSALLAELAEDFGPLRMFRPNRDIRFAKDKSPYKLWTGATSESRAVGGIGYYLSVSATQLVTGYGAMVMASDQLQRFRAAIDAEKSGREFEDLLIALAGNALPVTSGAEPPLKKVPAGYPVTHPRAEILRWKGAAVVQEYDKADWMLTSEALSRIRDVWHGAQPFKDWLSTHVGTAGGHAAPLFGPAVRPACCSF